MQGGKIGDIHFLGKCIDAVGGGFLGNVTHDRVAVEQCNGGAFGCEGLGNHAAHSVCAADNDGDLTCQFQIHRLPLLFRKCNGHLLPD